MPGMEIPTPGGTMKKMQFEFTDPAEAAQQGPQIPAGAGIPPAGAQGAVPPAGMQPQQQQPVPEQGGGMLADFGQQMQSQQPAGDSSLFTDEQLAQIVGQEDPDQLFGSQMAEQAGQDPMIQQQLMEAARRRMMGGGQF